MIFREKSLVMLNEIMIKISLYGLIIGILIYIISFIMLERYLWKRNALPKWRIIFGCYDPFKWLYGFYVRETKKEYGHIGIWIKLLTISFIGFMVCLFLIAFFH